MVRRIIANLFLLLFISLSAGAAGILNVWNPPSGTAANTTFTVQVRKSGDATWTDLFEYNVKVGHQTGTPVNSSMVNFDFSGTVDIKVTYNSGSINAYDIRPSSYGLKATQSGSTLTFSVTQDSKAPRKIAVRINNSWDTGVLHIVTNNPETDVPSATASNVYAINPGDPIPYELPAGKNTYYFKPGLHTLPKGLWVEVDMGATYTVNKIGLNQGSYNTNAGQVKYLVETKVNAGDAYTTAYDGTANTSTGSITQTFTSVNARYVRLRLLGNNAVSSFVFASVINEFSVFAAGGTTNLALNKAIAGGMPNYAYAVDGDVNSSYISSTAYGNWHAGESFFLGKNNTTVYMAPGAIVKGSFMSDGCSNISIKGRGILDCSDLRHALTSPATEGRTGAIWLISGNDNLVEGITILDPPMWSVVMNFSQRPVVKGINLIASAINADGIHFSGSSDGRVEGIFIRTPDDNLVMYHYGPATGNSFRNSVLWGDDAHIALIGLGGSGGAQPISNLTFQNLDVLNQQGVWDLDKFNGCFKLWPNGGNQLSNVVFDNIRVDSFRAASDAAVFQFRTDERYSGEGAGSLRDVTVSNLTYKGNGERQSLLKGVDASHDISGVSFINYMRRDNLVTDAASGNINVQSYVSNVKYTNGYIGALVNLALNKTATSDQAMYSGYGAGNAVDGSIASLAQASARTTPWKLTIDLDSTTKFNRIVFKSGFSEYASVYVIEGSNNGSTWSTIVNEAGSSGGTKTYKSFGSANYRYVRLNPSACSLSAGDWGYSILEFEIYNDSASAPVSANLALQKAVITDQEMYTGYDGNNITDGKIGTYAQASARTTPWSFIVDLEKVTAFNRLVYKSGTTNYASTYTIKASDDRFNWQTIVTESSGTGGTKSYNSFGNISYRYLKLEPTACVLDAGGTWGYAILEFEVYNDSAGTQWSRRNDNATAVEYYGANHATPPGYYLSDCHYSGTPGDYATFTFSGTGCRWIGKKGPDHGKADIYIDGVFDSTVDTYSAADSLQVICYSKTGLSNDVHAIRIIVRSDKNASSSNYFSDWDAFDYYPGSGFQPTSIGGVQLNIDKDKAADKKIQILPSPMTDHLYIVAPSDNYKWEYELVDLSGAIVAKGSTNAVKTTIYIRKLNAGMYILRLRSANNENVIRKLIKN